MKTMTSALILSVSIAAMATVKPVAPSNVSALQHHMKFQTIFELAVGSPKCPSFVTLKQEVNHRSFAKPGDQLIRLNTAIEGMTGNGGFAPNTDAMYIRPGLTLDRSHTLHRRLSLTSFGPGYSVLQQVEVGSTLTTELTGYAFSPLPVPMAFVSNDQSISFDSQTDTLQYHYAAFGAPSVDCRYEK